MKRASIHKKERQSDIKLMNKILNESFELTNNPKHLVLTKTIYKLFLEEKKKQNRDETITTLHYSTTLLTNYMGFSKKNKKYISRLREQKYDIDLLINIAKKYDKLLPENDYNNANITIEFKQMENDLHTVKKITKQYNNIYEALKKNQNYNPQNIAIIYKYTNKINNTINYARTIKYTFIAMLLGLANISERKITKNNKNIHEWENDPSKYTVDVIKILEYTKPTDVDSIFNLIKNKVCNYPILSHAEIERRFIFIFMEYKRQIKPYKNKNYRKGKIYSVINLDNDKQYIGSTCGELKDRFEGHLIFSPFIKYYNYKNPEKHFKIKLLEEYPCNNNTELLIREDYYIVKNNTINDGYNRKLNNILTKFIFYKAKFTENVMNELQEVRLQNALKQLNDKFNYMEKYNSDKHIIDVIIEFVHIHTQKKYVCYANSLYSTIINIYTESIYSSIYNGKYFDPSRKTFIDDFIKYGRDAFTINYLCKDINKTMSRCFIKNHISTQDKKQIYNITPQNWFFYKKRY